MTIAAARRLVGTAVCFVGIGLPSAAANLARLTHAPNLVLIYESGAIGAKPTVLPLSIGDGELAETADTVVSVSEIFNYWLQGGRIDLGFLGAAQIDRVGNINTTVIGGSYEAPKVRLPGAGGASEIASGAREVLIIVRHARRAFVPALDFVTSSGFWLDSQGRPMPTRHGRGPTTVISDLAVLHSDPATKELVLHSLHPGVSIEQARQATGWELRSVAHPSTTPPPSASELAALRGLYARTAAAHQLGSAPDPAAVNSR
jgi:glutaconate CoA-transferase subunit B